jgi:hypothetical protein
MRRKTLKLTTLVVLAIFLNEICFPTICFALGGGPSQPEVQSFEPSGTTNMVDLFSGDFTYNIPLFDVEGYPINIAYHSGVTMDQEASWVGLGWNINPGAITRNVRGIPDDFDGDQVIKSFNIKDNKTFGLNFGLGLELIGLKADQLGLGLSIKLGLGIVFNNYKGVGYEFSISPGISAGKESRGVDCNLGLSCGSQSGAGFSPSISMNYQKSEKEKFRDEGSIGVGATYNTRGGLKALSLSTSFKATASNGKDSKVDAGKLDAGVSLSFAIPTYSPTIQMPMRNRVITLSGTLGTEIFGLHGNLSLTGYESKQMLRSKVVASPAYGYIYSQDGRNSDDNIKDFNREKDMPYSDDIPNLPLTNFTYDLFSITGQGTSGMFRSHRSDVGIVCDRKGVNTSSSGFLGVEIGLGTAFRLGVNLAFSYSYTKSGMWAKYNDLKDSVYFMDRKDISSTNLKPFFEPSYFKVAGEKEIIDETFYNKLEGEKPIRIALHEIQGKRNGHDATVVKADHSYEYNDVNKPIVHDVYKTERERRNQVVSYITMAEAEKMKLPPLTFYEYNKHSFYYGDAENPQFNSKFYYYETRKNPLRKGHHIAEILVTNPDGRRYVYGMPAYNFKMVETTFAVGNDDQNYKDYSTGLVTMYFDSEHGDNTIGNQKGVDNYFSRTETPPFAHSYLLTSVLSPDYVDVTNDGISADDLGTAIKFNYLKMYHSNSCSGGEKDSVFKWRVPIDNANYDEGFKCNQLDNKGNYLYGEKEVFYMHSVESRNYILEFYLSPRTDARGVKGENGGCNLYQFSCKLDSIALYSKQDKIKNPFKCVPIKTAHFKYNNNLCKGLPNAYANGGKLTLEKLYFTYGNSSKGRLNSYEFQYDANINPNYHLKGYDRWGNYKPFSLNMPNSEFPYVNQIKDSADKYMAAWSLSSIKLPSGGKITVNYESDDYAYVQNKPAMQMFTVLGVGNSPIYSTGSNLFYTGNVPYPPFFKYRSNSFIYFKLNEKLNPAVAKKIIQRDYIKGMKYMYFKFLVDLMPENKGNYDYVPGYAQIKDYNLASGDSIAYIELKEVGLDDKENADEDVNPIAKAAWQFLRLNLPQKIFGDELKSDGSMSINSIAGFWNNMKVMFKGYNRMLRSSQYCKYILASKSSIRLYSPTMKKLGGGARVKEISLSDEWSLMGKDRPDISYGQTYDYTKEITLADGTIKRISSGVAAYEPMAGNDENPWRQPIDYKTENLLAPDDFQYIETPLGESFFPSPDVGYSQITVRNITPESVKRHATGCVVTQFYTAYDFPTKVKDITPRRIRLKPESLSLAKLLGYENYDYMYASQGYVIELNDMHGKMKSQKTYQEDNVKPISTVEYSYYLDENDSTCIGNKVTVIGKNKQISTKFMGKEKDVVVDVRNQETATFDPSLGFNLDGIVLACLPMPLPTIWPKMKIENTGFKSVVVTKVIQKYGILKKTVATDLGSKVSTENIAFDQETGDVILTKINNEYNDTSYHFEYPAYWIYDGMGMAYNNIGATFENVTFTNGVMSSNYQAFFKPGDEIFLSSTSESLIKDRLWALQTPTGLKFIDDEGKLYNNSLNNITAKVTRSGCRNMQSLKAGSITTLNNPIKTQTLTLNQKVIEAKANVYSEDWQTYYKPPAKNCDSLSLFACNLLNLLNYLWAFHLNKTVFDFSNDSIKCNNQISSSFEYARLHLGNVFSYDTYFSNDTIWRGYIGMDKRYMVNIFSRGTPKIDSISSFSGFSIMPYDLKNESFRFYVYAWVNGSIDTLEGYTNMSPINYCYCTPDKDLDIGDTANPYLLGIKGNWRQKKEYVYSTTRKQTLTANNNTDIRYDGIYDKFNPFWSYNSTTSKWSQYTADTNWLWTSEVSLYDPHGSELENRDPLNRYTAQLVGYNYSLPIAIANNTKNNNIAYDGFEDYFYEPGKPLCQDPHHWGFNKDLTPMISSAYHHSGWYSMKVEPSDDATAGRTITDTASYSVNRNASVYVLKPEDFIYGFMPDPQKYVISGWVNEASGNYTNYGAYVLVTQKSGSTILDIDTFYPSGTIIDGWQRIYGTFNKLSAANVVDISLKAAGSTAYFDDIRVNPFNSNMKSYVYDHINLRLMAQLDENNYATFYEYDDEGQLIRIKKETVNGIMTIQESRKNLKK